MAGSRFRNRFVLRILILLVVLTGPSAAALAQIPYTEEAVTRGIDYLVEQGDWLSGFGCGVAFADLDGDGDPDVVVTGNFNGDVSLYENDGSGQFTDRSSTSGIPRLASASAVTAGDYQRSRRGFLRSDQQRRRARPGHFGVHAAVHRLVP
jgi:hypothetical protein